MAGAPQQSLRISELLASLALAADAGTGLPPETGLKTTLLAVNLLKLHGASAVTIREAFYAGLVRHGGCSATSLEENRMSGDDVELRGAMLPCDPVQPVSLLLHAARGLGRERGLVGRVRSFVQFLVTAPLTAKAVFSAQCEVASRVAARLGLDEGVQAAVGQVEERHDGRGVPHGVAGDALRPSGAALKLAEIATLCLRLGGPAAAKQTVAERSGAQLAPDLATTFAAHADGLLSLIEPDSVWDAVMAVEPVPHRHIAHDQVADVAFVFADFADLKSPFTLGHSRAVALLCRGAAEKLGLAPEDIDQLALAALLHDIGRVAVANSIWDKPGPLNDGEWDRVHTHSFHTERVLRRSPAWAGVAALAAAHHERGDGSGYHKGLPAKVFDVSARVLQAADVYAALMQERAHRPAFSAEAATAAMRAEVAEGRLEGRAVNAVLEAAGRPVQRAKFPDGLSTREVEVLVLVARGLSNKEVGTRLHISPRTVQRHTSNAYAKIGVESRAAAALYAAEHGLT